MAVSVQTMVTGVMKPCHMVGGPKHSTRTQVEAIYYLKMLVST